MPHHQQYNCLRLNGNAMPMGILSLYSEESSEKKASKLGETYSKAVFEAIYRWEMANQSI